MIRHVIPGEGERLANRALRAALRLAIRSLNHRLDSGRYARTGTHRAEVLAALDILDRASFEARCEHESIDPRF